jgi:hypothetical protein
MFSSAARETSATATTKLPFRRRRQRRVERRNVSVVRSGAGGVKEDEDEDDDAVASVFKKIYVTNAGKRIKYGVFQETIVADDENYRTKYTEEEKRRLREEAARDLTVIDAAERKRRGEKTFRYRYLFLFVRSFVRVLFG